MTKISIEPKIVFNLGGYIVESVANLPYRDVVVGNPKDETIKINAPIYNEQMIDDLEKQGLIIEKINAGESLGEALRKVKEKIGE
ncbi:MAG: energy-converting hydrogenase B subunit EhbP [Candidatus Altiarchaeota archaeon]